MLNMSNFYDHETLKLEPNNTLMEPSSSFATYPTEVTTSKGSEDLTTTLNVLTTGNPQSGSHLIVGLPWSEFVSRPDARDRYRLMADSTDKLLQAVDVPGMNAESASLPAWLSREVASSNFDTVARLQWQALGNPPDIESRSTSLLGYGMGVHIVAELAKNAPEGVQIDQLILWEAVSQRQHIAKLGLKFAAEERRSASYRRENPSWMQSPVSFNESLPGTKRDYLNYCIGMSKGTLAASILEGVRKEIIAKDTEVIVVSGTDSRVSSPEDNHDLVNFLRRAAGMTAVRQYELENESHSMINSAPRMAEALQRICR